MSTPSTPFDRTTSVAAYLARLGFRDGSQAEGRLARSPLAGHLHDDEPGDDLLEELAAAADPDLALNSLLRILDAAPDPDRLVERLESDRPLLAGVVGVLGVSEALGDHLVRHAEDVELLDGSRGRTSRSGMIELMVRSVGADPATDSPTAEGPVEDLVARMRRTYRALLLQIARADVVDSAPYDFVVEDLSHLADAALAAALAIARGQVPGGAECRLAVIAMGKCGAQELNYVSDVDVVFVVEPGAGDDGAAVRTGTAVATALMRACSASSREGPLWEVDAGLRPEGRSGALVRTVDSHVGYYQRWAQTWEFQALLKARPAAGNSEVAARYCEAIAGMVWQAAGREHFVEDVQAMRLRVERSVPLKSAERQLKLGVGGLRDVEFSVQLLQLVHGRSDRLVRRANTMHALEALATYGYVGRKDAAGLVAAYRFLRTLEHRLQLFRLSREHVVPDTERDLRRVARSLGFTTDPIPQFDQRWRDVRREVRRLHEKLFYRPLLQAVARLDPGEARLTPEAARERLVALGFADPESALRHLQSLTAGVSRRAAIQRTLLPVLLGWFADSPDPDAALLGFRQVSEALGGTHWYLRLLRDESLAAQRLATILGSSRYATDLLMRAPEAVAMLAEGVELGSRDAAALRAEALSSVTRHDDPVTAIGSVRAFRRRELFRIAVADLLGRSSVDQTVAGLSDVTAATITAALQTAVDSVAGTGELGVRFLVVAMGRLGGGEVSYGSDADVMFVHEAREGTSEDEASRRSLALANELIRLLSLPSPDPELLIDADLRPEGRSGPVVRSFASYQAYYARWSSPWESQALLRARPLAGDEDLGERFMALADRLRYPHGGLDASQLREIRRLKARMESERLPRGADPALHTKLGRGGLSDVEWTAQLLQLQHAGQVPQLRVTATLPALAAAVEAGLLADADREALASAWRIATGIRNAIVLATGKPSDQVPTQYRTQRTVAHLLGYPYTERQQMVEDYRRATRRARKVMERVFYGD